MRGRPAPTAGPVKKRRFVESVVPEADPTPDRSFNASGGSTDQSAKRG